MNTDTPISHFTIFFPPFQGERLPLIEFPVLSRAAAPS
jgi:hypothetical protein